MSSQSRDKFYKWYNEHAIGKSFNFKEEAIKYCITDCDLLRKSAVAFHKMIMEKYGVAPFHQSVSLSHLASLIYRKL